MWKNRLIDADELWTFAYEDGNKQYFPKPIRNGTIYRILTKKIWYRKYSLITKTFGFEDTSWEAQTTPMAESFWQFTSPDKAVEWLNKLTSSEFDSVSFREVDL